MTLTVFREAPQSTARWHSAEMVQLSQHWPMSGAPSSTSVTVYDWASRPSSSLTMPPASTTATKNSPIKNIQ